MLGGGGRTIAGLHRGAAPLTFGLAEPIPPPHHQASKRINASMKPCRTRSDFRQGMAVALEPICLSSERVGILVEPFASPDFRQRQVIQVLGTLL